MPKSRGKLGYDSEVVAPYVIPVEYTVAFFDNVVEMINDADMVVAGSYVYKDYSRLGLFKKRAFK